MRYSKKATAILIQYTKNAMKPINEGEVLGGHQITTKGRVRLWFRDILEGNVVLINERSEGYAFAKLHYEDGWTWTRIAREYKIPESTLRRKVTKFFRELVENMDLYLGLELLRIDKKHKAESLMGELEPRWEVDDLAA